MNGGWLWRLKDGPSLHSPDSSTLRDASRARTAFSNPDSSTLLGKTPVGKEESKSQGSATDGGEQTFEESKSQPATDSPRARAPGEALRVTSNAPTPTATAPSTTGRTRAAKESPAGSATHPPERRHEHGIDSPPPPPSPCRLPLSQTNARPRQKGQTDEPALVPLRRDAVVLCTTRLAAMTASMSTIMPITSGFCG
jgi:hypothetical protein